MLKLLTILASAALSAAQIIQPGTYKIVSLSTKSTVRSYQANEVVYVSSTREYPGPFENWQIDTVPTGSTIKNLGLNEYLHVEKNATSGAPVKTSSGTDITSFDITRTGQGTYQVQLANSDLFWTVLPPAIPRGEIHLAPASGDPHQQFQFVPTD